MAKGGGVAVVQSSASNGIRKVRGGRRRSGIRNAFADGVRRHARAIASGIVPAVFCGVQLASYQIAYARTVFSTPSSVVDGFPAMTNETVAHIMSAESFGRRVVAAGSAAGNAFVLAFSGVAYSMGGIELSTLMPIKQYSDSIIGAREVDSSSPEDAIYFALSTQIIVTVIVNMAIALMQMLLKPLKFDLIAEMLPYSVLSGFIAGISFSLIISGLEASGMFDRFILGIPAIFMAICLQLQARYKPKLTSIFFPCFLLAGCACFYIFLAGILASSTEDMIQTGWLLEFAPNSSPANGTDASQLGSPWMPWMALRIHGLSPSSLLSILPGTILLALIITIQRLMIVTTLNVDLKARRVASKALIDAKEVPSPEDEIKKLGIFTFLTSAAGFPGIAYSFSGAYISREAGIPESHSWLPCATVAGTSLLLAILGHSLLTYVPRFIIGTVLINAGLANIYSWVYQGGYKMLRHAEFFILLLVATMLNVTSLTVALGAGICASALLLIIDQRRVGTIYWQGTACNSFSYTDRPPAAHELIVNQGESVHIIRLSGMLTFATARKTTSLLIARAHDKGLLPLRHIIVDFMRVLSADATSGQAFRELCMDSKIANNQVTLHFCGMSSDVGPRIINFVKGEKVSGGRPVEWVSIGGSRLLVYSSIDDATHGAEDLLLRSHEAEESWAEEMVPLLDSNDRRSSSSALWELYIQNFERKLRNYGLDKAAFDANHLRDLLPMLRVKRHEKGELIWQTGTKVENLIFFASGQYTMFKTSTADEWDVVDETSPKRKRDKLMDPVYRDALARRPIGNIRRPGDKLPVSEQTSTAEYILKLSNDSQNEASAKRARALARAIAGTTSETVSEEDIRVIQVMQSGSSACFPEFLLRESLLHEVSCVCKSPGIAFYLSFETAYKLETSKDGGPSFEQLRNFCSVASALRVLRSESRLGQIFFREGFARVGKGFLGSGASEKMG